MAAVAYVNGRMCDEGNAVISVFDHGFLFGDGVYEVIRTYHGVPFLLDRHLARLRTSASMIALSPGRTDAELEQAVRDTMAAYRAGQAAAEADQEFYVRILLTRGLGDMTYDPASSPAPTLVIIVKPLVPPRPAVYTEGVKVSLVPVVRNHPASVSPLIKSNCLLNNALAMQEALRRGAFEAILRNYRGEISECSQSNIFVVKNGVALTPRLDAGLLAGITRAFIREVALEAGVPMEDAVLHDGDLFGADELFLTSTTREVVPIVTVDDRIIGGGRPGPITTHLLEVYRRQADLQTGAAAARS